ncbi:MAG: polysaccharide biosynthesis tyrosine autokinase [Proteobacteria bacterium]|nr:polysaccharide biosynthesis tyrosine autokinase [Pseudomonadota bacterium]
MRTLHVPPPIQDSVVSKGDSLELSPREIIGRILAIVVQRRWAVLLSASAVIVAGVLFLRFSERQYSASTKILIHPAAPQILDQVEDLRQEVPRMNPILIDKYYHTQEDIITAREVAELVVVRFGLDRDENFLGTLTDKDTGDPIPAAILHERAIKRLRRATALEPLPESEIFVITVTDNDPHLAAQLADGIALEYQNYSQSLRLELTTSATEWLHEQVDIQRIALSESEEAIQAFRQEHSLESMSIDEWTNSMAESAAELTDRVATAEMTRTRKQAVVTRLDDWIEEGKEPAQHPLVASDAVVQRLAEDLRTLERQQVRASERRLDGFPGQRADQDELSLVRDRLDREVERVLEGLRSDLRLAQVEEELLQAQLDRERVQALELGGLEVEYNRLRRFADTNARLYEQILRRSKEIELSQHVDASTVNIIERARPPERPSHPRVFLSLLVTLFGAGLMGILAALIMDSLDASLRDPSDLETLFHIRPMGIVPIVPMDSEREVFARNAPTSAAAECLRSIRTNLLFAAKQRKIRRVLVTSGSPKEGKTTLCVNFGATMALAGNRVLLIDTDMRRPRMHRIFKLGAVNGVANLLAGECELEEALHATDIPGLDILPCGPPPPDPAEQLGSNAFDALLDRLQERYDYLVLDSPPTLAVTDSRILAQKTDATLLVARIGYTDRRPLRDTLRALRGINVEPTGVILNQVDLLQRGYGYYAYNYYHYYSDSEGETGERGRRRRRASNGGADI